VKLDPVDEGFIMDRASMSGPSPKGFKICLARPADVGLLD
jgi:hypothetical protein